MVVRKDIRHPKAEDAATSQTEGGKHPRGVDSKNYERPKGSPPPPGEEGKPASSSAGKHADDQTRTGLTDEEAARQTKSEDEDWRNK